MIESASSGNVILVVDDHEVNRELLSIYLGSCGYKVIEASNGLEAVRIATRELPHLIIMDLSMPVLDGFGAAKLIREVPAIAAVPIVACTAHDSRTHREQAMSVGFDEFLTKPIDFTALESVVDRFLKAA
jgi:two-component system response regulator